MSQRTETITGLRTIVVDHKPGRAVVVMLHGYAMTPEDLAPFANSLGIGAHFVLPEAPWLAHPEGRAWWDVDVKARAKALAAGPRDLFADHPSGAPAARQRLLALLSELRRRYDVPLALVGFSQGGMLACDTVLRDQPDVAALALLSSSRIAFEEWSPLLERLKHLPVLVSHGRQDAHLSFRAGEALRDMLVKAEADVTWVPFDEGHEIPLVVWRALKKFLTQILARREPLA